MKGEEEEARCCVYLCGSVCVWECVMVVQVSGSCLRCLVTHLSHLSARSSVLVSSWTWARVKLFLLSKLTANRKHRSYMLTLKHGHWVCAQATWRLLQRKCVIWRFFFSAAAGGHDAAVTLCCPLLVTQLLLMVSTNKQMNKQTDSEWGGNNRQQTKINK